MRRVQITSYHKVRQRTKMRIYCAVLPRFPDFPNLDTCTVLQHLATEEAGMSGQSQPSISTHLKSNENKVYTSENN